jgi:hypothetical protein
MLVQSEGITATVCFAFFDSEDGGTLFVENASSNQVINPFPRFKGRIELNQWFWPKNPRLELCFDVLLDVLVSNLNETGDVLAVVANQTIAEVKDIHVTGGAGRLELGL